jgi:hypothetical protein
MTARSEIRIALLLALLVAIVGAPGAVGAQSKPSLALGSKVRLVVRGGGDSTATMVGTLVGGTDSSLVLRRPDFAGTREILRTDVEVAEVSGGSGKRLGAFKGFAIGAGAGAIIGLVVGSSCGGETEVCSNLGTSVAAGAVLFGAMGSFVGMARGSGERWHEVPVRSAIGVAPLRGRRLAVGATFSF